jgi:hypothetical protein
MLVSRRTVFMSLSTVFVGGNSMLFGFAVAAMIVMMRRLAMMVGGVFVMRCRLVMMFARRMFCLCHETLPGFVASLFPREIG